MATAAQEQSHGRDHSSIEALVAERMVGVKTALGMVS
jgi:hypothetical protein